MDLYSEERVLKFDHRLIICDSIRKGFIMHNIEDIEIDNLLDKGNLFKPLTDGLGFHHSIKEKKDVAISLKQKSMDLKSDLEARAKKLNTSIQLSPSQSNIEVAAKSPQMMGELSAFYAQPQTETMHVELEMNETSIETASLSSRFLAYSIDLILVASMLTTTFISALLLSEIPFSFFSDNILNFDFSFLFVALASMFYVFYFSFFDRTSFSTPGKRVLGLRTKTYDQENISFVQGINRSLITLLSFLTLGLGAFLCVQDKLTDSVVVKE